MHDNCNDCPVNARVDSLAKEFDRYRDGSGKTHKEMFAHLSTLEQAWASMKTILESMDGKMDSLTIMVQSLTNKINEVEQKPAKRWEGLSDKVIWFIAEAILIVAAVKVGLR